MLSVSSSESLPAFKSPIWSSAHPYRSSAWRRRGCATLSALPRVFVVVVIRKSFRPAATRVAQRHVHRTLGQFLIEAALIEFGHQRALQLVAFVEEGDADREADLAEDFRVLRPGDPGARAQHRRQVAIGKGVAGKVR